MVLVRNVSNELVMVGERYLFPTEQRWVENGPMDVRLVVVDPSHNEGLSDEVKAEAAVQVEGKGKAKAR